MIRRIILATAALAAMSAADSAQATNLVSNGDFTAGSYADWTASPTPFNTPGNNFTSTSCGTEPSCAVLNSGPGVVPQMTQTISGLTIGEDYVLSWDMASYFLCCGNATVPGAGAGIDGKTWFFAIGNDPTYHTYTERFTYTGASNTLTFYSQTNGTDTDAAFTNISLAPVPEPANWALMLVGFGGLGAGLRFRRRVTTA